MPTQVRTESLFEAIAEDCLQSGGTLTLCVLQGEVPSNYHRNSANLWSKQLTWQRYPGPLSRRAFLEVDALALGGLTLEGLLAARISAGQKSSPTSVIKSEHPIDRPSTPHDLLATIYRHLGIRTDATFDDDTGRPIPTLFEGEPVREL